MSVKLTKIYLTDLQRWVNNKWVNLHAISGGLGGTPEDLGPTSGNKVVLFPYMSQGGQGGAQGDEFDPQQTFRQSIDWDSLKVQIGADAGSLGWTIFGDDPLLVSETAPSVRIRYKLEVYDNSDPQNVYSPAALYYQIIKGSHPADHITYVGMVPTGVFSPRVTVTLPGLSNSMVANSASLFSWMQNEANWRLTWTKPGGQQRVYAPNRVTVDGTYKDDKDPEYGGATVVLGMEFPQINIAHSGQHKLELEFLPNDQQTGGFHLFADSETWVAVVTAYTPSMEDPLMMSFDKTLFLEISFAESGD